MKLGSWLVYIYFIANYVKYGTSTKLLFELNPATENNGEKHGFSKKCISEWLRHDNMVLGTYRLINTPKSDDELSRFDYQRPSDSDYKLTYVTFEIRDKLRNSIHLDNEVKSTSRQFFFSPTMFGEHTFCFIHQAYEESQQHNRLPFVRKMVELELRSSHEIRKEEISPEKQQAHLEPINEEMRKIDLELSETALEIEVLRKDEQYLRDLHEQIYKRIKFLGILFLISLISLMTWQLLYLRKLFRIKKIM
jgi:hypothetical protein